MKIQALFAVAHLLPLVLPWVTPLQAQAFDGGRAMAIVREISAESFAGRKSGLAGGRKIEEYVGLRFAEWGLEPAGRDGTFFHAFPMLLTDERGAQMMLLDSPFGEVSFLYGDDFTLITNSGSGTVTAEVIAVGHGLNDEWRRWEDYGETDVRDKIVLILRGAPDNGYDWGKADTRDSTLHEAVRRGAAAVLFTRGDRAVQGAAIHAGSYFPEVPIFRVGRRVLDHLFCDTGYDFDRYRAELKDGPLPLPTGKRLRLQADVPEVENGLARNVVGRVSGWDPELKHEIILIGAHMDHIGTNGEGLIYNGANDNGSGTAVVLELARALQSSPQRLRRTIVLTTFAGEEQGLLGSKAFAENPTIDLDAVVAMINLDMVGHGTGKVGIGGGEYYPRLRSAFKAALDSSAAESLVIGRAWGGDSSDHAPFREKGVPVGNIWSEGDHRFYHTVEDDAGWVEEKVLAAVGRMAEGWVRLLADWPEPLSLPHRVGRCLLYAAYQVDFDGSLQGEWPSYVHGGVRWIEGTQFATEPFLASLGDLHTRAEEGDSLTIIHSLGEIDDVAWDGKRALMLGLRERTRGRIAEERVVLLKNLDVVLAGCRAALPTAEDTAYLDALAHEGMAFLLPVDSLLHNHLPRQGRIYVHLQPSHGDWIAEPDSLPRKRVLFVVSLEGRIDPAELTAVVRHLDWDRVHLDLVPWIARRDEREVWAFLEELQTAGDFTPTQMQALLGGNLDRL